MTEYEKDQVLKQRMEGITSRHVGRLMERLEEIQVADIIKDAIRKEFWLMCDDCKDAVERRNNV